MDFDKCYPALQYRCSHIHVAWLPHISHYCYVQDLQPPKNTFIEVIVLRDCGVVMTQTGPRAVHKDDIHFVRKSDAEPLIRCGYMRHVTDKA